MVRKKKEKKEKVVTKYDMAKAKPETTATAVIPTRGVTPYIPTRRSKCT